MLDLKDRIAALSPEKRALLEQQLAKTESDAAARRRITRRGLSTAPLSFSQQRLWFIDQLDPGQSTYNLPNSLRLLGEVDEVALRRALSEIVRRHEVLRTTFELTDQEPVQRIHEPADILLPVDDLHSFEPQERVKEARRRIAEVAQRPFDLEHGPVFRAGLLKLAQEEYVLLLNMHHIASDAWSRGIFIRELRTLYDAFHQGRPSPLPDLPVQYADYAVWQREWLQGEALDRQIQYWKEHLTGAPTILELPTDRPRPAVRTFRGAVKRAELPIPLLESLKRVSQNEGTTLFMTLLAAFQILLWRYSGQNDIVVGTPTAGRTREEVESLIGFFVNTLALRSDLSGDPTFRELLSQVRETALGAFAHQDLPFERLVEEIQPERSMSHSPIIQVMFQLDNAPRSGASLEGLRISPAFEEFKTAKLDLQLSAVEVSDRLGLVLEYSTDLFDADRMERLLGHYQTLLEGVVDNPDAKISRLPLLTEPERGQLLAELHDTNADYPKDRCIHELFEEQAARTPDAIAVVFEDQSLTYSDLNARSNRLARFLRKQGVGPDALVGIWVERSLEMVIGVLGILKAGGAYLPMDPSYPVERVTFMLQDSSSLLLLSQKSLLDRLEEHTLQVFCLDDLSFCSDESDINLPSSAAPENLAYVIYTSGSTGLPKGVLITHANVARLMAATWDWYRFDHNDVWTLFHSLAFDFSVWELWGPLLYGGRLVVVPYMVSRSPDAFYDLMVDQKVTILNQTPSAFRQLLASLPDNAGQSLSVRRVIFGGEALDPSSLERWYEVQGPDCDHLINMYGITETTVHVTYRPLGEADRSAGAGSVIGCAIPDLQVYLLGPSMEPVPVGVPGEIYVGGSGLARGYLGRPDLTAQRFVPDPFSNIPGSRLYRSGDLARCVRKGELEYLGRVDDQVKIRGFRIELGEIAGVLSDHTNVKEAAVITRDDKSGAKQLVGYVVGQDVSAGALREHLGAKLPDYMVPSAFVFLPSLPLTSNGKLDRKALPAPEGSDYQSTSEYVAPSNPAEEAVTKIFANILGVERVGIHDSFFDLGGHSMLAIRLLKEIAKVFGRKLPIRTLFESSTPSSLVQALTKDQESECGTILNTVVPLQASPESVPFFCVAAPEVNSLGYVALGRHLGPDQPFFILHSQYRKNRDSPYTRKELSDMAAINIAALREMLPNGPYCLGGMCDGVHIAFEMALKLREAGEEVPFLISFDAWPEENTRSRFGLWVWFIRLFIRHPELSSIQRIRRMAGFTWAALTEWTFLSVFKPETNGWVSRYWPGSKFKPDRFDGKIIVLRVDKQESFRIPHKDLGWSDWTTDRVEVYSVPGDHATILRNENVSEAAVIVRKELDGISRNGKADGVARVKE